MKNISIIFLKSMKTNQ